MEIKNSLIRQRDKQAFHTKHRNFLQIYERLNTTATMKHKWNTQWDTILVPTDWRIVKSQTIPSVQYLFMEKVSFFIHPVGGTINWSRHFGNKSALRGQVEKQQHFEQSSCVPEPVPFRMSCACTPGDIHKVLSHMSRKIKTAGNDSSAHHQENG